MFFLVYMNVSKLLTKKKITSHVLVYFIHFLWSIVSLFTESNYLLQQVNIYLIITTINIHMNYKDHLKGNWKHKVKNFILVLQKVQIFGRLPPLCSWLSWIWSEVVFIQLPAVWIRRVREAFISFAVGCWAYEARGEHNQGPMTSLSWDWRVCSLSRLCLCVGDVCVRPVYLDDLLLWCYLWMCTR